MQSFVINIQHSIFLETKKVRSFILHYIMILSSGKRMIKVPAKTVAHRKSQSCWTEIGRARKTS